MSISTEDILHILAAISLLLATAHVMGHVFALLRQARVIGEIAGGLLLGPTLLGALLPEVHQTLFAENAATKTILAGIYQAGLFILMFCSGAEMRSRFQPRERNTAIANTVLGILIPLGSALLAIGFFNPDSLIGTANSREACTIIFGIAVAVTSIPVISRILTDLGFLDTKFGRIVLLSAILEDVILYVLLAIALALVNRNKGDGALVPSLLDLPPGSWPFLAYHIFVTLVFLGTAIFFGPQIFRWVQKHRYNLLGLTSPIAFQLIALLVFTAVAILLGITPMFGAFVAGIIAGRSDDATALSPLATIRSFSFAFFIPIYFAIVGLKLDLLKHFDPAFFVSFLLFACTVKIISVFLASRISGESSWGSWNLAVAMNARGGPGIVLASVALDAAIISHHFYASLILLSIITSMLAGAWLNLIHRRKWPLLDSAPEASSPRHAPAVAIDITPSSRQSAWQHGPTGPPEARP